MILARLRAAWAALWADPTPMRVHALALRDCGPSGPGARVRDHLPVHLSPEARAVCLARLDHGERLYGVPLAIGWEPAPVELVQELADAVHYAVAMGSPAGLVLDLCHALDTAIRLCRTTGA